MAKVVFSMLERKNQIKWSVVSSLVPFFRLAALLRLDKGDGTDKSTDTTESGGKDDGGGVEGEGSTGGTSGAGSAGSTGSGLRRTGGGRSSGTSGSRRAGSRGRSGSSRGGCGRSRSGTGDRGGSHRGGSNVDGGGRSGDENRRSGGNQQVVGVDTVRDGGVGDTVGGGGVEGRSRRGDGLTNGPELSSAVRGGVSTGVSLSEGRGGSVGLSVKTWGRGNLSVTRGERVVGGVEVGDGHDELTTHHVELVFTLESSCDVGGLGGTDSKTELVKGDERHPLLVEDVLSGRDVGSDVSSDGVTDVLGTVGVELSSRVTEGNVDLGTVPETVDLNVRVGLDEVSSGDDTIWDQTSVVSRLCAVRNDNRLDISDQAVGSSLRGTEETKVVNPVQGEETGKGSLVDLSSDRLKVRFGRVGHTVGVGSGDLGGGRRGEEERSEQTEHGEV